jgi:SOS-response transcriptional repressor LexA
MPASMLPSVVKAPLTAHLTGVRALHQQSVASRHARRLTGRGAGPGRELAVRAEVEWYPLPRSLLHPGSEYRLIKLTGDSMVKADGTGLLSGDYVLVNFSRTNPQVLVGKVVCAWTDGNGATVKRLFDDGTHWRLQPDNPFYPPQQIEKRDERFQVAVVEMKIGKVD